MTIILAKHRRHKIFFKQTTIWRLSLLNALRHFLVNDNIFHRTSTHAVYLPYSYNSIGDEDEEDNERFNKGCDCPLPFFKPSQGLQNKETGERSMLLSLLSFVCIRSRVNLMFTQIHSPYKHAYKRLITCICECMYFARGRAHSRASLQMRCMQPAARFEPTNPQTVPGPAPIVTSLHTTGTPRNMTSSRRKKENTMR